VAGVTTNYALDPTGPSTSLRTGLAQVLIETTSGQNTHYLPGLAQYSGNAWNYYLPDRLGSVRQMVDPSAAVTLARSYDPFGNVLEQVGAGQSSFGYTGEQTDPTGLVFLRARYYNPAVGRFLTADSVVPDPLSSGGWNRYAYVGNNPINYVDPSGQTFKPGFVLCLFGRDPITRVCKDPFFGGFGTTTTMGNPWLLIGLFALAGGFYLYANLPSSGPPGFNLFPPGQFSQPTEGFNLDETFNQCSLPGTDLSIPGSNPPETFPLTQPYFGPMPGFNNNPIPIPNVLNVKLHGDAQGKHIPGHKNYQTGKSILTHPDPQGLLDQYAGTGNPLRGTYGQPGYRERVNFGEVIGIYVDETTGARTPTTNGVIHYSGRGAHIVPARP
jgi:RHS repeat-associated protein